MVQYPGSVAGNRVSCHSGHGKRHLARSGTPAFTAWAEEAGCRRPGWHQAMAATDRQRTNFDFLVREGHVGHILGHQHQF